MNGGPAAVALIGDPVAQSVSPEMQRAAFAALGLDLDYVAVRVPLDELPAIWPRLAASFRGLNVTRPLKQAVIPYLDGLSEEARRARSVNTVRFVQGRAEGHSTDGAGFLAALRRAGVGRVGRALVLGTGGAARAVVAALRSEGTVVRVSGRNRRAGQRLANELGARYVPPETRALSTAVAMADLLVNATPVGSWPDVAASPLPDSVQLHPGLTVFDLVYRPRRTALLDRAARAGCRTVGGIEMLVEQGARSFELWTGLSAPVEIMREAALRALRSEGGRP
ncbi:MAG TPA: shikimate dehydrogenase [Actinomycetota bacterium]|nr:shikimate dehydrogenase [Actinomycetota bacterium]